MLDAGGTPAVATLTQILDASSETSYTLSLWKPLLSASLDSSTPWPSESASTESLNEQTWQLQLAGLNHAYLKKKFVSRIFVLFAFISDS